MALLTVTASAVSGDVLFSAYIMTEAAASFLGLVPTCWRFPCLDWIVVAPLINIDIDNFKLLEWSLFCLFAGWVSSTAVFFTCQPQLFYLCLYRLFVFYFVACFLWLLTINGNLSLTTPAYVLSLTLDFIGT